MRNPVRVSYVILIVLALLLIWLHLGIFLLTSLFGYLALQVFCIRGKKGLSISLYLLTVIIIGAGLVYFSNLAYHTLPKIAATSIPAMVEFAEKHQIELPFTDYDSLKSAALDEAKEGSAILGRYAGMVSLHLVLMIAGLVVPVSIFLSSGWTAYDCELIKADNFYSAVTRELTKRFQTLFQSFAKVMGAQIIISAINTGLTAAFLLFNHYPFGGLLTALVFLCGLLPIVGNILSNIVIVGVGFTISARTGIYALVFLIVIHKLEYFLNSKIVGRQINSPMWLTLIGLVVGERLMGVSGMILAPVILHAIRVEASEYRSLPNEIDQPDQRYTPQ